MVELSRRTFFSGLAALVAAPAIVKAESLMKLAPTEVIRSTLREIYEYLPAEAGEITRLDVLYGTMSVRPEWTVEVAPLSLDEFAQRVMAPTINALSKRIADSIIYSSQNENPHFGLSGLLGATASSE